MKRILTIVLMMLLGLAAGAQDLHCTFTQNKTIRALNKETFRKGSIHFNAPEHFEMIWSVPKGEYLTINGNEVKRCIKGAVLKFDANKNARVRNMRDILLDCITGEYEKAARDYKATLTVEEKGDIKTVALNGMTKDNSSFSLVVVDYNKKGLPVRMILDEFIGINSEYFFTY